MPELTYAGQVPRSYTETRDAAGGIVGTVEHGDKREFEGDAPDERWITGDAELPPAWPGVSASMYRPPAREDESAPGKPAAHGGDGGDGSEDKAADAPAGPVTPPLEAPASLPAAAPEPVTAAPDVPHAPPAAAPAVAPPVTTTPAADGQIAQG